MYQITRLPNGLTVATAAMPHMASVSLGLWVGVGSRYESEAQNGAAHFIEHLLFKGTRRRNAQEISEAVEGIGGYLNAFTGEESTCFFARAKASRFEELLDVLCDMFLNSKFDPAEIARERDVIKEELAMYLDQPAQHVQELLNETLWPGQALGRNITGSVESLNRLGRKEILAFMQENYVAGSTLLVAAGDVVHRNVVKAVKRFGKHFPNGRRPVCAPALNGQKQPAVRLFTRETEQTQLALAVRTCSRHDERRYALRVLNAILGENMSSRLFQVVREQHGLAYSIVSSPSHFDDTGDLVVSAGVDTDDLQKTMGLVLREMRGLIEKPPAAAELRRARDYIIGQFDLSLESTENQMTWLGEQWLCYGKVTPPQEIKRRILQVTAAEVRSVARDFFRSDRLNLALVSPLKSASSLEKSLKLG